MTSAIGRIKQQNDGFTLIELALVGVILSILLSLSMPVFSKIYINAKLKAVTQELTGTMRYAYQSSISEGGKYKINFDLAGQRYWLQKETSPLTSPGAFSDINTSLVKPRALPEGVVFKQVSSPALIFNPSGAGDNERIYLQNKKGEIYTIWYSGLDGQIQVFDYEKQQ